MNRFYAFLFALIFLPAIAFSQQLVFDEFAVDSTAQPRDGMDKLTLFLKVNQRPTLPMQVRGANGRVFVQGIVELDGSLSEPTVLRSLQPDFDREALRMVGLFRAWRPARKGGQAVRQKVTVPVEFRVPPAPWTYENGIKTQWFNADAQPVTGPAQASFRIETRVDSLGNYTGDAEVFQTNKPKKVYLRSRFERIPVQNIRSVKAVPQDSANYIRLALTIPGQSPNGEVRYLDKAGNLHATEMYEEGKSVPPFYFYHPNGVLSSLTTKLDEQEMEEIGWYPTGQIREIVMHPARPEQPKDKVLSEFWLASGEPLVVVGNGAFRDTVEFGNQKLIEFGTYRNGRKDGPWRGEFTNAKPYYDEEFRAGELVKGTSYSNEGNPVEYTIEEQQAAFKGGQLALSNFLIRTLRYPVDAQRARAQGKVFVSFVVETNGTISDVQVLNHPNHYLEQEAIRVVRQMDDYWNPGLQRGRPVKSRFTLPITFQLE